MKTPREFYQEKYPHLFSDTTVVRANHFDKDFFEYYLSLITSRNQEKAFEVFCRKLAEKEICPNLKPQTGPTGGGDSKVDAETYPVAQEVALTWYLSQNSSTSEARWGFAFSAKADWVPKIKDDIKKIHNTMIEEGRNYSKVFFITNQFVPDKKGAEIQDKLSSDYPFEVTILDRHWIVEKVFSGKHFDIAVECLGLSSSFAETKVLGPNDYAREQQLTKVEEVLKEPITSENAPQAILAAYDAALLSRELERPHLETIGRFERLERIAKKHGTSHNIRDCLYEWAKTLHWWHENYDDFSEVYTRFEMLADQEQNVHTIVDLTILWFLYLSQSHQLQKTKEKTKKLLELHDSILSQTDKKNAIAALKGYNLCVTSLLSDNESNTVQSFIKLFNEYENELSFDFLTLSKIAVEGPLLKGLPEYDTMFTLVVKMLGKRKEELAVAKMQIDRAHEIADERPYSALQLVGKSITFLCKHESQPELISALFFSAIIYEKVGCLWAARAYGLHALYLCANKYMNVGEVSLFWPMAAHFLSIISLRLGHIHYALEFYKFERIAFSILHHEGEDIETMSEKTFEEFDIMLATVLTAVDFKQLKSLSTLPAVCAEQRLDMAEIFSKYMLGYYDEEYLGLEGNSEKSLDEMVATVYSNNKDDLPRYLWLADTQIVKFESKLAGSSIKVTAPSTVQTIEFASSLLAAIESFLVTAMQNNLLLHNSLDIRVVINPARNEPHIEHTIQPENRKLIVKYTPYTEKTYTMGREIISEAVHQLFFTSLALLVISPENLETIEEMITEENALERALTFCETTQIWTNIFGQNVINMPSAEQVEPSEYKNKRCAKVDFSTPAKTERFEPREIIFDKPPELNEENIPQNKIHRSDLIDISLWDRAGWRGCAYVGFPQPLELYFGILYADYSYGKRIFEVWKSKWEKYKETFYIGIIKGVSKKHPYYYRVVIGEEPSREMTEDAIFMSQVRMHTMEVENQVNLNNWSDSLKNLTTFKIFPADPSGRIIPDESMSLELNTSKFIVRNIWEVEANSWMLNGLLPTDIPIIKSGYENAPAYRLLKQKSGKIGPNEPCPCGSGKKYKKCCRP